MRRNAGIHGGPAAHCVSARLFEKPFPLRYDNPERLVSLTPFEDEEPEAQRDEPLGSKWQDW